jgi:hypothetical protein
MSKIQTIKIENFKAISEMQADFNGCTAIVTGSNNKGKTSFLRGIPDRIRFVRPEVMVKEGSTQGRGEMTLDSGERFVWEFNKDGKDVLNYFTAEKAKRSVTTELGAKFFPKPFDIDKFLNSTPKEQSKQLQKVVGLDFTDIDKRYADAYANRTDKNRAAEKYQVKLTEMMEVPKVLPVDISDLQAKKEAERTRLNKQYQDNKAANEVLRNNYNALCRDIDAKCAENNNEQANLQAKITDCINAAEILERKGYTGKEVGLFIDSLKASVQPAFIPSEQYPAAPVLPNEMPDDTELKYIDDCIITATKTNLDAQAYIDYVQYKSSVETAKQEAEDAKQQVEAIEAERLEMIRKANFPKGIELTIEGITVDGLPLDRGQLSSSRIAIAALQIAALNIGEVKTLFFDASFLDRKSLNEVNSWAIENDYQLLIERPAYDEQEITYTLIQNTI